MVNAEQAIIGCILMDADYSLSKVYEKLKPEMFSLEFTKNAYEQVLNLYDKEEDINVVTLANAMESKEHDSQWYIENLVKCTDLISITYEIQGYAETLVKQYKSREIKSMVNALNLEPNGIDGSIDELLIKLEMLGQAKNVSVKTMEEIVNENIDNYGNDRVGVNSIPMGFYNMDSILSLERGDVTVIGARPATGKSAMAAQIAMNMAERGYKVGYFNLEMLDGQIFERYVSMNSGIDLTRLRRAKRFNGDEIEQYNKATEKLKTLNIQICSDAETPRDVRIISKHRNYDVIIVDYMQLLSASKRCNNRQEEVASISREFKKMAKSLNTHIILLSQLNRASEGREDKEPTMSELRESGSIEQDASNIMLLWNVSKISKRFKGFSLCKQRQGELRKEGLEFDGKHMTFTERREDESFGSFLNHVKDYEKGFEDLNSDDPNDMFVPF